MSIPKIRSVLKLKLPTGHLLKPLAIFLSLLPETALEDADHGR